MPRQRLCKVCREWHDVDDWPVGCECTATPVARGDFPVPMMNLDTMDAVRSMADGLYYDSKSALRKAYKQGGYIEVGDQAPMKYPEPRKGDKKARQEAAVYGLKRAGVWDSLPG